MAADDELNYRVEKHVIKKSHPYYNDLDAACFASKNLYNHANYLARQAFFQGMYLHHFELNKLLKEVGQEKDYRSMPDTSSAEQCLRKLDANWTSFYKARKEYAVNPDKFTGRPGIPKYLDKKFGRFEVAFPFNSLRGCQGNIILPKNLSHIHINSKVPWHDIRQVRIVPKVGCIIIEVVYDNNKTLKQTTGNLIVGVDLGIDNFAAIARSDGGQPLVINGRGLKSFNKHFNKLLAKYKSTAKQMNNLNTTNRIKRLHFKRNMVIENFMHKASRFLINYCISNGVGAIVIGYNKGWKQNSKMSKKTNQTFVQIPYRKFIDKVIYKAADVGIPVYLPDESYTSGTSFPDNEQPVKESYNKSRRIHRGLFISNKGIPINADINGAYQVIKKVFPNSLELDEDGVQGVGIHPVRVNVVSF